MRSGSAWYKETVTYTAATLPLPEVLSEFRYDLLVTRLHTVEHTTNSSYKGEPGGKKLKAWN